MNHLDLFTGIGGFHLAASDINNLELVSFCEIDKSCKRVIGRHWPKANIHHDITTLEAKKWKGSIDLITGGFPCQDISIAGNRAGLAGRRSGLWYEMLRVISECRPRFVIIENVGNLLSSQGGRDFAAILHGLGECGYNAAWRILDAKYFGIPQRRRRVYIAASFGNGSCSEILFKSESLRGDTSQSGETGQDIAATIRSRSSNRGVSMPGRGGDDDYNIVSAPLETKSYRMNPEHQSFVVAKENRSNPNPGDPCHTLHSTAPSIAWHENKSGNLSYQRVGVRRLTPLECERLQGFPDYFTRWDAERNEISDSQRYRMIGNAIPVPVVRWILNRIPF